MAKVYNPPEGIEPPAFSDAMVDGRFDFEQYGKAEETYLVKLRQWLATSGYTGALAGEELRFPYADGYARYLVMRLRPVEVMHLPLGDGWAIPDAHMRGISAADVRQKVEGLKAMRELFSGKGTGAAAGGAA